MSDTRETEQTCTVEPSAETRWTLSTTVHKGRYNIFDLTGAQPYHVGTLISGSNKHKNRFERDARLVVAAPALALALAEIAAKADLAAAACDDEGRASGFRILAADARSALSAALPVPVREAL